MGELILFRPAAGPRKDSAERAESAKILFFTGVRYQRMSDPLAASEGGDSDAPRSGGVGDQRLEIGVLGPATFRLPSFAASISSDDGTPLPNERRPSERMAINDDALRAAA